MSPEHRRLGAARRLSLSVTGSRESVAEHSTQLSTLAFMPRDPDVGLATMLVRALQRRCSRCGGPDIFRTFGELKDHCPTCGFRFERESGYWVGAMIINTTVTFALFLITLVGGVVATWPDVAWTPVFAATIVVCGVVPILFYPRSKTVWQAIELSYHPLEPHEIDAARAARASSSEA